jgi:uncharacterized membrane protein
MKSLEFIKREAINWLFILLPFIYILSVYDRMPRFDPRLINGEQIIYWVILFIMGTSVFWYFLLLIKPSIVPQTAFHNNLKSFHRMKTLMLAWPSILSLAFISEKIGIDFNWAKITFILGAVFIMAMGNLYPTIRFNYFIGIRTSWTRSNEFIWRKTHQFAGKVFFWGGLAGALYGIFFNVNPVPYMPAIFVGYVFGLVFIPKIYSYILYKRTQSQNL